MRCPGNGPVPAEIEGSVHAVVPVWLGALSCGMPPAAHLGPLRNWASGPVPQA